MALTCPKCAGEMRGYERNGVTIDQCTECRGIFLDRGELDRLVDAEGAYYGKPEPPRREPEYREQQYRHHDDDDDDDWRRHGSSRKKHRESFLGELFG
jgi:Zn-finger nucleic acid-binding protein